MNLAEKYRPKTLNQVVGQGRVCKAIDRLITQQWGGRGIWITGPSGTGKTTVARIIARRGADKLAITELTARELTPAELKTMYRIWRESKPFTEKDGWALIVNESHGLSRALIEMFLQILEDLPDYCLIVFTTTLQGQARFDGKEDSGPFASRCITFNLNGDNLTEKFAKHAKAIAEREGLDGQPIEVYKALVEEKEGNLRAVLQSVEAGELLDDDEFPEIEMESEPEPEGCNHEYRQAESYQGAPVYVCNLCQDRKF